VLYQSTSFTFYLYYYYLQVCGKLTDILIVAYSCSVLYFVVLDNDSSALLPFHRLDIVCYMYIQVGSDAS